MIKRTSALLRLNEISTLIVYAGGHDYVGAGESLVDLQTQGKKGRLGKYNYFFLKKEISRTEHSSQTLTVH